MLIWKKNEFFVAFALAFLFSKTCIMDATSLVISFIHIRAWD